MKSTAFRIVPVAYPAPPAGIFADSETPVPQRPNRKPRKQAFGAQVNTGHAGQIKPVATTYDGRILLWPNQTSAAAAMASLMR